ncbi:MAG: hypothetical protein KAT43_06760 [Nanoarchaeota archaeon]|nr:hypothetical protein [Nanoarchaeota archaeon]
MNEGDLKRLESMLKIAKTPEAKGALIYKIVKADEDEKEKYIDKDVRFLVRTEWPIEPVALLQSEKEGVLKAAALAFKDDHFKLGFTLAIKGDVLETIITQMEQVPTEDLHHNPFGKEEIPKSIQNLPGFHRHLNLTDPDYEAMGWVSGMFNSLINTVLEPMGEHYRAARIRIQQGRGEEAIHFAHFHLGPEELAELCEMAQAGFYEAIEHARKHDRKDIVSRLQEKHVQSLVNGTHATEGKNPKRWNMARELAKEYGHIRSEVKEVSTAGIDDLLCEFEREVDKWRCELSEAKNRRDYEQEYRIRDARTSYIDRLSRNAAELVKLIKKLPEKEQEAAKKKLYQICDGHHILDPTSPHDAFGIAIAFEDYDQASRYGSSMSHRSDFGFNRNTGSAMSKMESEVLPHVGEDQRKAYLHALMSHESWDGHYEHSFNVANRYGLAEWLMEAYEKRGRLKAAANIAKKLGNNEKAKEIFVQSKQYDEAIKCSDSPIEQASLCFLMVEETVKRRKESPSLHSRDNAFNFEVIVMQKGIELAKGSEPTLGYLAAAKQVIEKLVACGNYAEACLFIEEAGILKELCVGLIPPNAVETAEKGEDFASCYHLARLQDQPEEAEGYQILAKELGKEIPMALGDLIHEEEYLKKTIMRVESLFVELTPAQKLELETF